VVQQAEEIVLVTLACFGQSAVEMQQLTLPVADQVGRVDLLVASEE